MINHSGANYRATVVGNPCCGWALAESNAISVISQNTEDRAICSLKLVDGSCARSPKSTFLTKSERFSNLNFLQSPKKFEKMRKKGHIVLYTFMIAIIGSVHSFASNAPTNGLIDSKVNTVKAPKTMPPRCPAAIAAHLSVKSLGALEKTLWKKSTDNSSRAGNTGSNTLVQTLPLSAIENVGIVHLEAKYTRRTEKTYSSEATVEVFFSTPASPSLSPCNGQTIAGTYDQSNTTGIKLTDASGSVIATCSDVTNGCSGWTFSNGTFVYTPSPVLSDGDQVLAYALSNLTGTVLTSAASNTITVDAIAPEANIYATVGTSFNGVVDGTGYSVTVSYGSGPTTQSATVTGTTFTWTPSSSLGLSVGDPITYTITDVAGNVTTYTTTVQAVAHCIPVHTTGLEITNLTFKPDGSMQSDVSMDTYISDAFNDRSTTSTIQLVHDKQPEIFITGPVNTFYYQIWVDYNQDGDFDDAGEAITGSSIPKTLHPTNPFVFHSWFDPGVTSPLPAVPFENLPDGSEYIMRIGLSTTLSGVSSPCGSSSATANFQDLRIKVLNCKDPASLMVTQPSIGSAQLDVQFVLDEPTMNITYVIAEAQNGFSNPLGTNPDTWISSNNATTTTTTMTGVSNGTNYDYSFSATVDSEGNSLAYGSYYSVAIKKSCPTANWTKYQDQQGSYAVELIDPNGPDYAGSDFAITSHNLYTQFFYTDPTTGEEYPSNTLKLPVGESLSVKTTVKASDGSTAVVPSVFNYFDVVELFNYDPTSGGAPTHILGTINGTAATMLGQTALSVTNTNEVTYTTTPTSATSYWLTYTFKELVQGAQPLDAYFAGFANSVNVAWYEAPVLNSNGDGLTGAVPGETVTLVLDGTIYTATAGNDGTAALTSFTDGSSTLSSVALSALVNGSYSINQSWTAGGIQYTHANPKQVLSALSINAGANSVSGTAAPGATVTLTIGDQTFTTTADATTGIYDFAGTTSSTTSPSTGIAFNTLVPFTATTAYSINQSLTGYTSGPAVTGNILASANDIAVPTIGSALALSGSSSTVAGTAEAGSQVYFYDEDGNQLFDANGHPITTTADNQGAYSITVDFSVAQISTGSNTFASAYTSPYTGSVIQVGSTDTDGNTAPLSAAFVNPSVYTSSGTWTDASGTSISTPSTSGAASSSSPVIRYEKTTTLPSGTTGLNGLEIANGVTVTVPSDGCLEVLGSIVAQGTGALKLESASTNGSVQSAQLKFGGEYLGPPTVEMSGQLSTFHTIGSPMKEGIVAIANGNSITGDVNKLFAWDANTGTYYFDANNNTYSGAAPTNTKGLGYFASVGSGQFLSQAGEFRVIGSPMSHLAFSLGYAADVFSSTSAGSGWNLIANPFTCGWDFNAASLTNVNQSFYVKNTGTSTNGGYSYWATAGSTLSSSVIPPMQGFWIQTTGVGASIVTDMSNDGQLCNSSQNTFYKTLPMQVKISLEDVQSNLDYPIFLTDILGAQKGFDGSTDAWFLGNGSGAPEWCFKIGEEEVAANGVEYQDSLSIDIHFAHSVVGKKFRVLTDTTGLSSDWEVVLLDKFTGVRYNLLEDAPVISSRISPMDFSGTRFKLFMRDRTKVSELNDIIGQEDLGGLSLSFSSGTLNFDIPEFVNQYFTYELTDLVGRVVSAGNIPSNGEIPIDDILPNGTYVVRLMGQKVKTERIIISR